MLTELQIDDDVLSYNDCVEEQNELFHKLIQFIELKAPQTCKDYIEVINSCDYCDHFIPKPHDLFANEVNPCDIWYISIQDENEEDWLRIMGEDTYFTQEQIRIYRCQTCGKWEIDSDC